MSFHSCRLILVCILVTSSAIAEENRWRKLPPPPGRAEGIRSIALEQNTLWALASNSVFYWDGASWHKPSGPALRGGTYLTSLIGGGDRPLYCTQPGPDEGIGLLYRLGDGEAEPVAEFPYERRTVRPYMFVSRSGSVFHIRRGRIGILDRGNWNVVETPDTPVSIFEDRETVHLCFLLSGKTLQIRNGAVAAIRNLNLTLPAQRPAVRTIRWGRNRVLVLQRSKPKLQCFDLNSGDRVDVVSIEDKLSQVNLYGGFSTRDGSAWILARRSGSPGHHLVQIAADGNVTELVSPNHIDMQDFGLRRTPRRVLEAKDGSLWFGLNDSIVMHGGGAFTQYKQDTGYDLSDSSLVENPQGTIYAANGGVYAFYRFVEAPRQLKPPRIAHVPDRILWRFPMEGRDRLEAAWLDGEVLYATGSTSSLLGIDAANGAERFRQALQPSSSTSMPGDIPWWMGRFGNSIEFAVGQEVVRVDATSGEIQSRLSLPHDRRIAPVKIPGGYLVVPEYRGYEIAALNEEGEIRWRRSLPGYLMAHPTVSETQVVLQTRGSSYGGQKTLSIDFSNGSMLWIDQTDAYGQGVAFADSGRVVVETNDWLSPARTESWTIGRPQDGSRLWQYREAEQRSRPPIIDPITGHVYSALSAGKVVCLRSDDGSLVWEQTFSEGLSQLGGASSYFPAWSPHSLQDGKLLIVDKGATLHVLDATCGNYVVSVSLNASPPPPPDRSAKLIASPWITDRAIIAAFQHEIIAIPLPPELQERNRVLLTDARCHRGTFRSCWFPARFCFCRLRPLARLFSR